MAREELGTIARSMPGATSLRPRSSHIRAAWSTWPRIQSSHRS